MASNDLATIYAKIRRLLRSPSEAQITSAQIKEYVNTVILYVLPELVELVSMRKTFSFFTTPNVDTYATNTTNTNDPMYNFKNVVITASTPVYIGGIRARFTQKRGEFYSYWSQAQQIKTIGTGDGGTTNFTGTLTGLPILPGSILFSSIGTNNVGQSLRDVAVVSATSGQEETPTYDGNLYDTRGTVPDNPTSVIASNTINYLTGVYSITFTEAPADGETVYVQTIPYTASRPESVLFFNNTFILRPVPDNTYEVKIEAYIRPSELDDLADVPELEQWWQFIATYAAKLIAEDRTDWELASMLTQLAQENKKLVNRKSERQIEEQPIKTMYDRAPLFGYTMRPWSTTKF